MGVPNDCGLFERTVVPVGSTIFITKDGRINHDSLKVQHKKALKMAKLRPFEIYSIRHTFLTRLGESGCDAWTLARIAGHSSIAMSARYVHPSQDAVMNNFSRLQMPKELPSTTQ